MVEYKVNVRVAKVVSKGGFVGLVLWDANSTLHKRTLGSDKVIPSLYLDIIGVGGCHMCCVDDVKCFQKLHKCILSYKCHFFHVLKVFFNTFLHI